MQSINSFNSIETRIHPLNKEFTLNAQQKKQFLIKGRDKQIKYLTYNTLLLPKFGYPELYQE